MAEPKSQPIAFAYEALPELFHNDPHSFLTYLRRDKMNFLRFWWDYVGKNTGSKGESSADGLAFSIRELDTGITVTIISLPKPAKPKEAYYLALVLPKAKGGIFIKKDLTRIFTLEYRLGQDGSEKTIIGEVTPRLKHFDFGPGTEPTLEAFRDAVDNIIITHKI